MGVSDWLIAQDLCSLSKLEPSLGLRGGKSANFEGMFPLTDRRGKAVCSTRSLPGYFVCSDCMFSKTTAFPTPLDLRHFGF